MKIKVYVDYENEEVISEQDYNNLRSGGIADYMLDDELFIEWYTGIKCMNITDLLYHCEAHKKVLQTQWQEYCTNQWDMDNVGMYAEHELEI